MNIAVKTPHGSRFILELERIEKNLRPGTDYPVIRRGAIVFWEDEDPQRHYLVDEVFYREPAGPIPMRAPDGIFVYQIKRTVVEVKITFNDYPRMDELEACIEQAVGNFGYGDLVSTDYAVRYL